MSDFRVSPFPLSLQDMCKIYIAARLDVLSVETLALLPRKLRRRLLLLLSQADILHLQQGTAIFDNISGADLESPGYISKSPRGSREDLIEAILQNRYLNSFLCLDFYPALDYFDHFENRVTREVEEALVDHVSKCYGSHQFTVVPMDPYNTRNHRSRAILPSRFHEHAPNQSNSTSGSVLAGLYKDPSKMESLLQYCNMPTAPVELKIEDLEMFADACGDSETSSDEKGDDEEEEKEQVSRCSFGPIKPLVQDFLSTVEVLELGTGETDLELEDYVPIPYVLLYSILKCEQPRLRHLKIVGEPILTPWVLSSVARLFSNTPPTITAESSVLDVCLQLPSLSAPYLLEGLSVSTETHLKYYDEDLIKSDVIPLALTFQEIVKSQLHNLKTVHYLGERFVNVSHYRGLLSTLALFLREPQVHSLSITGFEMPEVYKVIETFLSTPVTHEQSLTVEMGEYEDKINEQVSSLSQPLPATNGQFKCLDLGHSSSRTHTWLFNLPELKLKSLNMRTQDLPLVPMELAVQVDHVTFTSQHYFHSYTPTAISALCLDKFIVSNPALKTLEFNAADDHQTPGVFQALNHCLSKLVKEEKRLEELRFSTHATFDIELNFQGADLHEFFTHIRDLSQSGGTNLVFAPGQSSIFSKEPFHLVLPVLHEKFRQKIKRIVCVKTDVADKYDPRPYLGLIADEVIVQEKE